MTRLEDPLGRRTEMGLFDVKTHFSEVVERVLREGRPITVTRRGTPVVDIVPSAARKAPRMTRAEALAALHELRKRTPRMGPGKIVDLIHEGRDRCPDS